MTEKEFLDLFYIIDSENWQEFSDKFFGYKFLDDQGIWVDAKKYADRIELTSSLLQPCLAYYVSNDYWALSNSCYLLKNHLAARGVELTPNPEYSQEAISKKSKPNNQFSFKYGAEDTDTLEIKLVPMLSNVTIDSLGIHFIEKNLNLFSVPIKDSKTIITNWYNKYKEYIGNLDCHMVVGLSGGFDSRFLYAFWKDNSDVLIHSYDNKPGKTHGLDGILSKKFREKYNITHEVCTARDTDKDSSDVIKVPLSFDGMDYFENGVTFNQKHQPNIKRGEKDWVCLVGTGTNLMKEQLKDYSFLFGNIHKNWIQHFISRYYMRGRITVCPYLDSELLTIDGEQSTLINIILYKKFANYLLEDGLEFQTYGDLYIPGKNHWVEECKYIDSILNSWEN